VGAADEPLNEIEEADRVKTQRSRIQSQIE